MQNLTQHRHDFRWIYGKATGAAIEVCYGRHGQASDFHVVRWGPYDKEIREVSPLMREVH